MVLVGGYALVAPYVWLEWPWPQRLPHDLQFGGYEYAHEPEVGCHSLAWWSAADESGQHRMPPFQRIGSATSALGVGASPVYDWTPLVDPHQQVFLKTASGCYTVYAGTDVPGG